jgi:hypothetical protein
MELSAAQRARLASLLEEQLRAALSAARDHGASPAAIDATMVDRLRLLEALFPADDPHDPLDQGGPGGGVCE